MIITKLTPNWHMIASQSVGDTSGKPNYWPVAICTALMYGTLLAGGLWHSMNAASNILYISVKYV